MRILLALIFVLIAWKWSNWKDWKEYYPTILFMIAMSLLADIITANHKLWLLINSPFATSHTANSLFITYTIFPATVLLYLSNFPHKSSHKIYYTLMWSTLYSFIEFNTVRLGLFTYDNGWSLVWSILFNCFMFPLLWLHHLNPILAWTLSACFLIFILEYFGFYIDLLK
jgi:hypothetical protein